MYFDVAPAGSEVAFLPRDATAPPPAPNEDADAWFRQGEDVEATDSGQAERAYRQTIRLEAAHAHAHLNLGAIRCEADPALLDAHYNAGCLLEKMGDGQGALRHFSAYRRMSKTTRP
jgi:hypothetical protein